jgi:hypothetical protein
MVGLVAPEDAFQRVEISPTVARARAASMRQASRLPCRCGRPRPAPSARRRTASSRVGADLVQRRPGPRARRRCRCRGCRSAALPSWYLLTPTTTSSPRSMRAWRAPRTPRCAAWACRLDGLGHAAQRLDLLDQLARLCDQARGQRFDVVAAGQRIDDLGDAGLVLEDQLGVARDAGRGRGRQRDRLVERVGVQRLRAAQHRRHRLDRWCGSRCCTDPAR